MIVAGALLHNTKDHRWHPILFRMAPLPGGSELNRLKSHGHHTGGFETRDAAIANLEKFKSDNYPSMAVDLTNDIEWDGQGVPAAVALLSDDNKLVFI